MDGKILAVGAPRGARRVRNGCGATGLRFSARHPLATAGGDALNPGRVPRRGDVGARLHFFRHARTPGSGSAGPGAGLSGHLIGRCNNFRAVCCSESRLDGRDKPGHDEERKGHDAEDEDRRESERGRGAGLGKQFSLRVAGLCQCLLPPRAKSRRGRPYLCGKRNSGALPKGVRDFFEAVLAAKLVGLPFEDFREDMEGREETEAFFAWRKAAVARPR